MEAPPAPSLEVPEPELLLQLLIVPLDAPAQFRQLYEPFEDDVFRTGRKPESGRPLLLRRPLEDEPFLDPRRTLVVVAVSGTGANAREARTQDVGTPLTAPGDLDFSAVGAKEATVSVAFKKGKQYWIGIRHSSTAVVSAWQAYTSPDLYLTAIATIPNKTLQRTLAYATAAPVAWGNVPTEAAATLAAAIGMRVG